MAKGKDLIFVINDDEFIRTEVMSLLHHSNMIQCPECDLWFHDFDYNTDLGDGCECHFHPCNVVFNDKFGDWMVCLEERDEDHSCSDSSLPNRCLEVDELVKFCADGQMRVIS